MNWPGSWSNFVPLRYSNAFRDPLVPLLSMIRDHGGGFSGKNGFSVAIFELKGGR